MLMPRDAAADSAAMRLPARFTRPRYAAIMMPLLPRHDGYADAMPLTP